MAVVCPKIRDDLLYFERTIDDEKICYVKDPLRGQFYRFNELQAAMMKLLDGKRTHEELAEMLSIQFEQEVPVEQVPRVLARLERQYLLDISSYKSTPESQRRRIRRTLKKKGFIWRDRPAAVRTQERDIFDLGQHHLRAGDPADAARCFSAVLEINPKNARARALLQTIQESYFRALRVTPSHMLTLLSFDPDRMLGAIDRMIGHFLFSTFGVLVLCGWFLISFALLFDFHVLRPNEWRAIDLLVGYSFFAVAALVHELSHGLACKHYGGTVSETGLMAFYGVSLGAYCDVSDSYLFTDARPKVVTQLAGSVGTLVAYSAAISYCVLGSDSFLTPGLIGSVVYSSINLLYGIIPLVKSDGYYALSDYLDKPNLHEHSLAYCAATLKRVFFGIESEDVASSTRERILFLVFGISSFIFRILFTVFLFFTFLAPTLIELLHGVGMALVVWVGYSRFVKPLVMQLVALAALVKEHRQTALTPLRVGFATLVVAGVVALLAHQWALPADGRMVVRPRQHATLNAEEDGFIEEILVREGQHVQAGQLIARLVNFDLLHERAKVDWEIAQAKMKLAMLSQGARAEEVAVASTRWRRTQVVEEFAHSAVERAEQLRAEQLRAEADAARARAAATHATDNVDAADAALTLLRAGARDEDRAAAAASLRKLEAQRLELDARLSRLVIHSPIDGTIAEPHVEEQINKQVRRGDRLCEVQDLSQVYAEVHLPVDEKLDRLSVGDRVRLKAFGDPRRRFDTQVARIRPLAPGGDSFMVVETVPIAIDNWPAGLSGHARIYGPNRSLAYRWLGLPLLQILDYRSWLLWG
jgi:putative peptide zinc metalloprotease protein